MQNVYLLKDLAQITEMSLYTIKFYLKIGLIKEAGRSPGTNFRYFDDSTVKQLRKIRKLRVKGISLKEIKELINSEE